MNFGTILDSMTNNCVRVFYEGRDVESKNLAKKFVNYVNMKEPLRRQFKLYTKLKGTTIEDRDAAKMFVSESISTMSSYRFSDILAYNALLETKFNVPKIKPSEINRDIGNLIKYVSSEKTTDPEEYVRSFNRVVEHVCSPKGKQDVLDESRVDLSNSSLRFLKPKHVLKIASKNFNKRYRDKLDENDRRVFNILRKKNQQEIESYRLEMLSSLKENIDRISPNIDDDLKKNLSEAYKRVEGSGNTESILYGYELLSELKGLNK